MKREVGAVKIDENLHLVECPWSDLGVTVAIITGRENLLIDAGPLDAFDEVIFPYIKSIGCPAIHLAALLHGHVDHSAGCHVVKERARSKLLAHRNAAKIISDQTFGFQRLFAPYLPYLDVTVAKGFAEGYRRLWARPCEIDIPLKEGDIIDLGLSELEVIETPGHDEDAISLYERETRTLFTGDAVQGLGANSKMEPTIPLYRDFEAYVSSLRRMLALKVDRLVTSHPFKPQCSSLVVGEQAVELIRTSVKATEQIEEAIMLTLEGSKEGIDLGRIAEEVQKRIVKGVLQMATLWTIDAQVTSLLNRRKVRIIDKNFRKIVSLA